MRLEIKAFLLCVFAVSQVRGQLTNDSVRVLKSVVITQSRLTDHVFAGYELPVDSTMLAVASNGSLADLLRKQGLGHMRGYGPNGPATPSFRGTGSSHTTVLWNGINLVSPLTGLLDLSLMPAGLFDNAAIQTGGSTSLSGNGSIGATIQLNNNPNFDRGLYVKGTSHLGSFGSQYYDAAIQASNRRIGTSTKIFFTGSDNNFPYTNTTIYPPETQEREHAAFNQYGFLQQLHWQADQAGIFSLNFWYQKSKYEVPNSTGILRPSEAMEGNEFLRTLAGWNFSKRNFDLNYQAAFLRQGLEYEDPVLDLQSANIYNSLIQHIETNFNFKDKNQVTTGIQYTWEQGIVDDFGDTSPVRNRIAFFGAYKFENLQDWKFGISAREELMNGQAMPPAATLSVRYDFNSRLHAFTNWSRNYRLPTFNDLYWSGGLARGNPDLKMETAWSGELGAGLNHRGFSFKAVLFNNLVDDWIQWTPVDRQVWMPQNIKEVWSRGIETQISHTGKFGSFRSGFTGLYSFTRSTNQSIYATGNPNEQGKQLILTPLHEASLTIEGEWKKIVLRIINAYTGEQFNDSDNTPYNVVDDYLVTNFWLSKSIGSKNLRLTLTGEINNVFNVDYVARPGYPMPGRNFKAGAQFNFNKPNKK